MTWSPIKALEAGQHREILERVSLPGKTSAESLALIGALAFLGRLESALEVWQVVQKRLNCAERARARFMLSLAATRVSKFKLAKRILKESLSDLGSKKYPDIWQGLGIYNYYLGDFTKAIRFARQARISALQRNDRYILAFATDLYGHALAQNGRRMAGIHWLKQARLISLDESQSDPISSEQLIYEAEAGLKPSTIVEDLQSMMSIESENSYTKANLTIELARQLSWRGKWTEARDALEAIAPVIFGFENRRQEALLQIRLAELSLLQSESFSTLHFLQSARRCLNRVADRVFERQVLELEKQVQQKLLKKQPPSAILERLVQLERELPKANRAIGEDPFADLMDLRERDPDRASEEFLRLGYLGLWAETKGFRADENVFWLSENGAWIAVSRDGVEMGTNPMTVSSQKLLKKLASGICSKEALIRDVWGYEYDPLRHDTLIYSGLNTLRRSLGSKASWLQTHDTGWSFQGLRQQQTQVLPLPTVDRSNTDTALELNWRQHKAVQLLPKLEKWTMSSYRKQFAVSTMTAWRDLDGLVKSGYVDRVGNGRLTAYLKT